MDKNKEQLHFIISSVEINALLGYLAARPYVEVQRLIPMLQGLEKIDNITRTEECKDKAIQPEVDMSPIPPPMKPVVPPATAMMASAKSKDPCICGETPCICSREAVRKKEAEMAEEGKTLK